jgi:general secretion pathway protein B
MSYILNALRKSEQERLAQQPDTVTGRILVNQPEPRHKFSKIIILLMICNLIVVAVFFWFIRKETVTPLPVSVNKSIAPEKVQLQPSTAPPVKMLSNMNKPVLKKSEPSLSSIAKTETLGKPSLLPERPIMKPAAEKNQAKALSKPDQIIPDIEPLTTPASPVQPVQRADKISETVTEKSAIPFLFELDPEFRRSIPELKINVFVYSEQPVERFVMIDMVKYNVGDRIKDSVTLKEIRSDSLVVEYNHRVFRIKRP